MNTSPRKASILVLVALLLGVLVGGGTVQPAHAQEGPTCPGGFFWRANSGVGCMQEGCPDIGNAKYSYTGSCICLDEFKPCYEPVDTSGVDCGPFCPVSRLTSCVAPDASCPGARPTAPEGESETAPAGVDTGDAIDEPDTEQLDTEDVSTLDELIQDLEEFLAGSRVTAPSAGEAAAAGTASATLIGTWVLINLLSGARPADVLRAISRRRGQRAVDTEPEGTDRETRPDSGSGEGVTERAPVQAEPATVSPTQEVQDTPASRPAEQPPEQPPDLPTLRRKRIDEIREARQRIRVLHQLRKRLDEDHRRLATEWEVTRRCAVFDGVLDIADLYTSLRGKLNAATVPRGKPETSTVRGAYGKDLVKRAIKGAFRKLVRYRVDGTFDLTADELLDGAYQSLGVPGKSSGTARREPASSQYVNPIELSLEELVFMPKGAYKQLLQNYYSGKGPAGKVLSEVYGPVESLVSGVRSGMKSAQRCEELRQQMSAIRTVFGKTSSALEDAQTDLEIAQGSLAAIDEDIAELKQMFPNRFRHL